MTSRSGQIRLGIIGANANQGWGSLAHIPALKALPGIELAALCTAHEDTARAAAEKFQVPLAFHDHRELIARDDIDAVAVVVRVPLHYQITMDVLRAGKHVYTEWPLGATVKEVEDMAGLARDKGLHTMVGLQGIVAPVFMRMRELVSEGYVGELVSCHMSLFSAGVSRKTSDRSWTAVNSNGNTTLSNGFAHGFDCFRVVVGDLKEVSGMVTTQTAEWQETDTGQIVPVSAPDHVMVTGRLENGAAVSIQSVSVPGVADELNKMEVFGTEGTLVASMQFIPWHALPGKREVDSTRLLGARLGDGPLQELQIPDRLTQVPEGTPLGPSFNVSRLYQRFADAINSGERREPDFDTALRMHRLVDRIQESSDGGQRLPVEAS